LGRWWFWTAEGPGRIKGMPKVMTAATLSGCTAAVRYPGMAPKSLPTRKA